jgi:uncharacterized protein (TIGR00251 family)
MTRVPEPVEGHSDHVLIRVRVQPRASRNALSNHKDGGIRVALTAPPVDGAANKALEEFLAEALGLAKRSVQVTAGLKSREKTVRVEGIGEQAVRDRLHLSGGSGE